MDDLVKDSAEDLVEAICDATAVTVEVSTTISLEVNHKPDNRSLSGAWFNASETKSIDWRPDCKRSQHLIHWNIANPDGETLGPSGPRHAW